LLNIKIKILINNKYVKLNTRLLIVNMGFISPYY